MTLYRLNQILKNYDLTTEVKKAIIATKKEFADYNRDQLLQGKNTLNNKILPRYKSKAYAKLKFGKNPKPGMGVPDLYKEGDFSKSIDVEVKGKSYDFISLDSKAPMLTEKYALILGVSARNREHYVKNVLWPMVRKNFNEKISK